MNRSHSWGTEQDASPGIPGIPGIQDARVTRQINFSKYIFFEIYLPVIRVWPKRATAAWPSAPLGPMGAAMATVDEAGSWE